MYLLRKYPCFMNNHHFISSLIWNYHFSSLMCFFKALIYSLFSLEMKQKLLFLGPLSLLVLTKIKKKPRNEQREVKILAIHRQAWEYRQDRERWSWTTEWTKSIPNHKLHLQFSLSLQSMSSNIYITARICHVLYRKIQNSGCGITWFLYSLLHP